MKNVGTERYTCFHKEFENPIFHKMSTNDLSTIQMQILDMNLKLARLQRGRCSIIKLLVKEKGNKTVSPMNDIKITITSTLQKLHENNNSSKFSTDLAEPISLYGPQWYVALVSCSVPTRY